jgi:hypothetical protein
MHDGTGPGSAWYLERVVVREWGGEARSWIFDLNGWIDDANRGGCELGQAVSVTSVLYTIAVHTGKELCAGTDANVRLALTGSKAESGKLRLERSNHSNKFEMGQVDTFKFELPQLGELTRLRLWSDATGAGAHCFHGCAACEAGSAVAGYAPRVSNEA